MHQFQNPFSLQSQQIARLTVGCLLAQGLVVGASRDLQRQILRFPFAVPLLPHSFCRARALFWGWACGQQDQGSHGIAGTGTCRLAWPEAAGGLSLATSPGSFFLMCFGCFSCCLCSLLWPYGISGIWNLNRCLYFFQLSSLSEST